jgi:hypothetical protein
LGAAHDVSALAEADVPLARIRGLRATQRRLRQLAAGRLAPLPTEVGAHLEHLIRLGFTPRWVDLQRDLWILVFATHPDLAITLFHDQAEALADPALRQLFLDYDHAHGLDAGDPRIDDLAHRIAEATRERYGPDDLPGPDAGGLRDPGPRPEHGQCLLPGMAATRHLDSRTTGRVTRRVRTHGPGCVRNRSARAANYTANVA